MKRYPEYSLLRKDLLAGETTCLKRVLWHLENISSNAHLNAFLSVYDQEARQRAQEVDLKIKSGKAGKLAGLVVGIKDVISYNQHPLQASSKILDGFIAQYNATVVQKLLDEDAIIIGRQNCDEFGMGSSTENSAFGPTLNPWDNNRSPGGSSGGSAAAVAADLCQVSIGSDTGGSVRQPAAFCGLFGLKPSYSRVSRYGLIAYASSFDCIGVIAHSAGDCAAVLEVIAGADQFDSTVASRLVPAYSDILSKSLNKKLKIAIMNQFPVGSVAPEIIDALEEKSNQLIQAGHSITKFIFPFSDAVLPTYYILTTAEASSNLSRFDGVRYGYRSEETSDLETMYKKTRTDGFGEEVKRRILLGNFVLSSDYYDSYFAQAQKVRRLIRDTFKDLFKTHDLLLMPTAPVTAFKIGAVSGDPIRMYLSDLFSVQANVAGLPAISVPCGKDKNGLPIGLQLMADSFNEETLLLGATHLADLA